MDFECDTTDNLTPSVKKDNFVSNYHGVKLSILHSWCQIVCFTLLVPNCLFYTLGVKLSANMGGVKLSMVSNCLQPWRAPRLPVNVTHPYIFFMLHVVALLLSRLFLARQQEMTTSLEVFSTFALVMALPWWSASASGERTSSVHYSHKAETEIKFQYSQLPYYHVL